MTDQRFPDGLEDRHAAPVGGLRARTSLISLIVLAALMAMAMSGALAGGRVTERSVDAPAATLTAVIPQALRNGVFFEMRLRVEAHAAIADATIAVPATLWRDMTINTVIPAASEESAKDGVFHLRYGELQPGDVLDIKIDGQINPPLTLGTAGEVALLDGGRRIAALPVRIRVLP